MISVFGMDREKPVPFKFGRFREIHANYLKKMLMEKYDDPTEVIKVVGVGGVGRRALSMYAYENKLIKKHFHVRVRVNIPAGISDTSIVEEINKELGKESSIRRLQAVHSRCLVVIDSPISMTTWGKVEPEWLNITGKGCKILLPWGSMHEGKNGSIIELGHLLHKAATIILFDRVYMFCSMRGTTYPTKEMDMIRNNIMQITGGLPLAVVILAKLMRIMDLSKWGAACAYLISYDGDT